MNKSTKILLAVLVAVMGVLTVLPEKENYYETARHLVADNYAVPVNQLNMVSGSYQNLMQFKTVEVKLRTAQSETIQAVMKQTPFSDWSLKSYAVINE